MCFENNVFCCYLPAHCSHGLQPLDNGVFNAVKTYYRGLLSTWQSLTDSQPVDKINFIKALQEARQKGFTEKNIRNAWKTTGNWPISRRKAMIHPECNMDKDKRRAEPEPTSDNDMPKTGRDIMDLAGPNATASERRKYRKISQAFNTKDAQLALADQRIAELEAQLERMKAKKRQAIPNPNQKFMRLGEFLDGDNEDRNALNQEVEAEEEVGDEIKVNADEESEDDEVDKEPPEEVRTRSGRASKIPSRYTN